MKRFSSIQNFVLLFFALCSSRAFATLKVVTTIPDLAAVASEVGGAEVSAESIAKGSQDPHFIEAKPSYMVKLIRADMLFGMCIVL
jgi:zinc/manganese transport system substrate-binding protein